MPIYAYKCESCGFSKDILRKMSDAPLSDCPQCGAASFKKQLTSAGFQLKGSGWYVTDFRSGNQAAVTPKATNGETQGAADAKPETAGGTPSTPAAPAVTATAPVAVPSKGASGDASSKPS